MPTDYPSTITRVCARSNSAKKLRVTGLDVPLYEQTDGIHLDVACSMSFLTIRNLSLHAA